MPLYDLMLLLDPTAPDERQQAILKEVDGMVKSGGEVKGDYDWGTRRLAFEIDHRPEAAYHLLQFETAAGGALLERIDHSLKIMDGVLRHRIIRLKEGAPPPPMPRPEGRRDYEGVEAPATDAAPAPAEAAPAPEEAPAPEAAPAETAAAEPATPAPQSGEAAPPEPPAEPATPAPQSGEPATPAPDTAADPEPGPAGADAGADAPSGNTAA
jgi:small subunit ribosomal protein S6